MTVHVLSQRLGQPDDDEEPDEVPVVSRRGQPCVLPDASRGMGTFFCATRGAGKSRSLGRAIAWGDLARGIPLVVLDPLGGTIDNLLDKIGRQPLAKRRELWKRVR